jgi:hypothetical protein
MSTACTYQLLGYDGGLTLDPNPADSGEFQLTDTHWRLLLTDRRDGLQCGLLQSSISVEGIDRRRSLVRLEVAGSGGSAGILLVAGRPEVLKGDLGHHMAALDRAERSLAAAEQGEWWMDSRVFEQLGTTRRVSIAAVRFDERGWHEQPRRRRWLTSVLDFGPEGIVLRGWRTRLKIPWADVASIEVTAATPVAPAHRRGRSKQPEAPRTAAAHDDQTFGPDGGTRVTVRSSSGQRAVFTTAGVSSEDATCLLAPLLVHLSTSDAHDN